MTYAGTGWEVGADAYRNLNLVQALALDERGVAIVDDDHRIFDNIRTCRIRITGETLRDVPYLTDIEFTGSQVNAPTYDTGETIELTATFSEPVSFNAPPSGPLRWRFAGLVAIATSNLHQSLNYYESTMYRLE